MSQGKIVTPVVAAVVVVSSSPVMRGHGWSPISSACQKVWTRSRCAGKVPLRQTESNGWFGTSLALNSKKYYARCACASGYYLRGLGLAQRVPSAATLLLACTFGNDAGPGLRQETLINHGELIPRRKISLSIRTATTESPEYKPQIQPPQPSAPPRTSRRPQSKK